ncbi:FAD-dependent oxidoreductase [Microbacterium kribbense]|uniref:FAD-dependent oxidoreductase n=1 Tax=Microbacterium kribbense TaxID=433645 RepID=A0ABP7G6Q4_9MICO
MWNGPGDEDMTSGVTVGASALPETVDVLVLGSGVAGLVAALRAADAGARVCVAEKAALLGGTTSAGGGVMWAPATELSRSRGFQDSPADGAEYLSAAAGHVMSEHAIDWYIRTARAAVTYLTTRTRVRLTPLARPDYRGEWPGAAQGGRSLDNDAFDPSDFPGLADLLRPSSYFPPLTMAERDGLNGRAPAPEVLATRRKRGVRTMGGALVGALAASALDRGIHITTEARATGLTRSGDHWQVAFRDTMLRARSVVLATGGFEWSPALTDAFLPFSITAISAPSNEGDGLRMGLSTGAAVADMTAIWGVPVIVPPSQTYDGRPSGRMGNVEMTLPGSIVVNSSGERFVNEALSYQDTSRMFGDTDPRTGRPRNIPAWLVFDHAYARRYPIAGSDTGAAPGWARTAETVESLAAACRIDAAGLPATITEFNQDAVRGHDSRFGRGDSPQDRFLGDATHLPNPCLAPLAEPPYSAIPLHPGVLGTSGGLRTDDDGRVLDWTGSPIAGLYAAGNVAASVFRNNYPGGGATIGSAVTRAFVAGAAAAVDRETA